MVCCGFRAYHEKEGEVDARVGFSFVSTHVQELGGKVEECVHAERPQTLEDEHRMVVGLNDAAEWHD